MSLASILLLGMLGMLAVPVPAAAAPGTGIDSAALIAVPAPACDIVLDPSRIERDPLMEDADPDFLRIDGPVSGLTAWAEDLLSDPARWGLTEYEYIDLSIAVHPRLDIYPLGEGPVIVANETELEDVSRELFSTNSQPFDVSSSRVRPFQRTVQAAPSPNAKNSFLAGLPADGTFLADMSVSTAGVSTAFSTWAFGGAEWFEDEEPFPRDLDVFIALRVGSQFDKSDQRGIIVPCVPSPALVDEPTAGPAQQPAPRLAVTCVSDAPRAGEQLDCTLHGAPADLEFLWRASINPPVAEGVITTGADGTGEFSIAVPADAAGATLSIEIVDWTGPIALGIVQGPVPTSVPAGLGVSSGAAAAWGWPLAALLGVVLLRGIVLPLGRRRSAAA